MLKVKTFVTNPSPQNLLRFATDRSFCKTSWTFVNSSSKMSVEDEKQKFLKMSLEEKRNHYEVNATGADQIPSWYDHWRKNAASVAKNIAEDAEKVDESLAKKVSMWQGDITSLEIDAIVNAANSRLMGGGGVDGAIHRAAGASLKKECATLGGCQVGDAKITGGYQLPARYIIHTVGPQGEKPEKLRQCYENSLSLAMKNDLRTIAFPCISTGVYGYPQKPAAKIALTTVKKFLEDNPNKIDKVIFCLFLKSDVDIYEELLKKYFALD